jgi:hypothetical protein
MLPSLAKGIGLAILALAWVGLLLMAMWSTAGLPVRAMKRPCLAALLRS